jgi:site-specific recombinase XerD
MSMRLSELPRVASLDEFGTRRVKLKTVEIYESAVNKLISFLGDVELEGLTGNDLLRFHEWLRDERTVSVATANTYRRTLRAIFNYELVNRPELGRPLKRLREPPRRSKAMAEETLQKMLMFAGLRDVALVMFLAVSGARRETVCNLRKSEMLIEMGEDGRFRLVAEVLTKEDSTALVMGTHDAAIIMLAWLAIQPNGDATDFVFTTAEGTPLAPSSINSIFRELKIKAGIPLKTPANPHALRHKFAHEKLEDGHDVPKVSGFLNHSSPLVTMTVYAVRSRNELIDAFFGDRPKRP